MISNKNDFQWDLLCPPQVHYCRKCWCIRGAFHNKFHGFSGFGFLRTLACKKTEQGTDKASEHSGHTVFSRALVLLTRVSTGLESTSSYHLSSINYTFSLFLPTSLFVSASATKEDATTNRVSLHQQQNTASPRFRRACECIWTHCPPTAERVRYDDDDDAPRRCRPLRHFTRLRGRIRPPPPKTAAATATPPFAETLRRVKGKLIHLHGLKNLQRSSTSTFTSSSDAASDSSSNSESVTSHSSASKRRHLGREGRRIPNGRRWRDPAPALDATVSPPPFSDASVRPLSVSSLSSLSSSSARLYLSVKRTCSSGAVDAGCWVGHWTIWLSKNGL